MCGGDPHSPPAPSAKRQAPSAKRQAPSASQANTVTEEPPPTRGPPSLRQAWNGAPPQTPWNGAPPQTPLGFHPRPGELQVRYQHAMQFTCGGNLQSKIPDKLNKRKHAKVASKLGLNLDLPQETK